jgi:hypothetical protein
MALLCFVEEDSEAYMMAWSVGLVRDLFSAAPFGFFSLWCTITAAGLFLVRRRLLTLTPPVLGLFALLSTALESVLLSRIMPGTSGGWVAPCWAGLLLPLMVGLVRRPRVA